MKVSISAVNLVRACGNAGRPSQATVSESAGNGHAECVGCRRPAAGKAALCTSVQENIRFGFGADSGLSRQRGGSEIFPRQEKKPSWLRIRPVRVNTPGFNEVYNKIAQAIAAFEKSRFFNRFASKFDFYLAGQATLSEQEAKNWRCSKTKPCVLPVTSAKRPSLRMAATFRRFYRFYL